VDPDPHPDLHEMKGRIRIRIWIRIKMMLDPDPHQFADDKTKCMEYEPILALFQGFESLFGS
jgi:hypothetical protein